MPKICSFFINSFSELKLDYHPAIVQRHKEQLFNAIAKAIRSSLDYELMLQTIVENIGEHFACTAVMLVPVKENRLAKEYFSYGENRLFERQQELIARVAATGKTGWDDGDDWLQLAVPLICQQELLAVVK